MFNFHLPTKIIFGVKSLEVLPQEIKKLGDSVVLITGRNAMRKNGILEKVEKLLTPIKTIIFDKVFPVPDIKLVEDALKFAQQKKCNVVVAIGGGSAIDVGKALAGLFNEKFETVEEFQEGIGNRQPTLEGIPFVAIPTTAGTGSEVTMNAVIYNRKISAQKSIRSPTFFAKVAIVDSQLTLSLPPEITAQSGMDAFTHLIECYISKNSNPICDMFALEGIHLVNESLVKAVKNGNDIKARIKMSYAAVLGGIVIVNSGPALAHGIASCLSGISHGLANAILLPYAIEYNTNVCPEKIRKIEEVLNTNNLMEKIKEINREIGIPERLSDAGIKIEISDEFVQKVLDASSTKRNPKIPTKQEVISLLEKVI